MSETVAAHDRNPVRCKECLEDNDQSKEFYERRCVQYGLGMAASRKACPKFMGRLRAKGENVVCSRVLKCPELVSNCDCAELATMGEQAAILGDPCSSVPCRRGIGKWETPCFVTEAVLMMASAPPVPEEGKGVFEL